MPFKRTFKKAKKSVKKTVNKVEKVGNEGIKEVKNTVDKSVKIVEEVAEKGGDQLKKEADLAKEGLEEAGNFLLNSSNREYWIKEISHLRDRLNELRGELNNKINTYYEVRIDYQQKIHSYITIRQDTIALKLLSSEELDLEEVIDTAGIVVDSSKDFIASQSTAESINRYALSYASLGISDILLAANEAKQEVKHLKQQISQLEKSLAKINQNIANHQAGITLIDNSLRKILQLYGDDTTIDNFAIKQCEFIYSQAQKSKVQVATARMQKKAIPQEEIIQATANI